MTLATGTRLGRYEIVGQLGAGGMGEVYRARDHQLRRDVAIKVLPASYSTDPDRLRRFEQEAQAAGGLNHPAILAIHDVGVQGGSPFLVSELLEGQTLRGRLIHGLLPLRTSLDLAMQLAQGLAAAHDKAIVHRDLKPENLFVTTDGRLKILDFGVAKLTQRVPVGPADAAETMTTATLTDAGTVLGTVGYMSPEQVRGAAADHRSDIFSFGVILYEMLAGRRAFARGSPVETMNAILADDPPSIWSGIGRAAGSSGAGSEPLPPAGAQSLDRVVRRCLEKRADDRFQSARDLGFALTEVASGLSAPVATGPLPTARPWRAVWMTVAALMLVAGLAWVSGLFGFRPGQPGAGGEFRIASLAVLPLENISNDPEQEYFSDGMTEALISDLARVGGLRVTSRYSVMTYKSNSPRKPLTQIARELNVDGVLVGSVMRSGDRVRISAQLIDGKTDRHIWANSYERDLRDVLALQGEVARAVAQEVKITLTPQEEAHLTAARPVNRESHVAYLRGRYLLGKGTERAIRQAIDHFNQAIALDPVSARPYAGLSDAYAALRFSHLRPHAVMPEAKAAAVKALELDPALAEGYISMAVVLMQYEFDWPASEQALKKAIDLSPNLGDAHQYYALYLGGLERHDEARREADRAVELDPLSPAMLSNAGFVAYLAGQYDRMIELNQKALDLEPNFWPALRDLGLGYERAGRFADAISSLQKAKEIDAHSSVLEMLAGAYAAWGKKDEARKVLAELNDLASRQYVCAYEVATVYAGLGDKDSTLHWLEKGYKERADCMAWAAADPKLDTMEGDARFQDVLQRIGLSRQKRGALKR